MTAPLSGRPCAAWRVIVEAHEGGSDGHWVKQLDECDSRPFVLEADGAFAQVEGVALTLLLEQDARGGKGAFTALPPELEAFCRQHDIETRTWFFNGERYLRYREGILEAGELVSVAGVGEWRIDPSRPGRSYRDSARRLFIGCLPDGELLVSDNRSFSA